MDSKWITVLAAGRNIFSASNITVWKTAVKSGRYADSKDLKLLFTFLSTCEGIPQTITTVQMSVMFWPTSQCLKSGYWSRPFPERLLWEWGSISSVPIYTEPASIERRNEARFSQQSGQETEGSIFSVSHLRISPLQRFPRSIRSMKDYMFCM